AALLQVTAVGHLRDHVGSAEQVPEDDVTRIGDAGLDLFEGDLVAGEMGDLARDRYPGTKAEYRQVLLQETGTARYVRARELGAVLRFVIIGAAQVTNIVKQPGDEPHGGAGAAEAVVLLLLPLVTDDEPCERERYVERVLAVVVDRVDAVIARHLAGKQPLEVRERAAQRIERHSGPSRAVQRLHRGEHGFRRAHLHAVGYIEVTAPAVGHSLCWRLGWSSRDPPLGSSDH